MEERIIYVFYVVLFCVVIYFLFKNKGITNESFTNAENKLASKIKAYFKSPQKNYIGYAEILKNNKNTSINLTKISTYNTLISKGDSISINQILAHF